MVELCQVASMQRNCCEIRELLGLRIRRDEVRKAKVRTKGISLQTSTDSAPFGYFLVQRSARSADPPFSGSAPYRSVRLNGPVP
jgi:hypothetical protein